MKRLTSTSGLITVIALSLCVIWLSPAFAAGDPTFESLGQIRATGMSSPGAIDTDDDGNLYVSELRGGKVYKIDQYGKLLAVFEVAATGSGLAVIPNGTKLYVAQKQNVAVVNATSGEIIGALETPGIEGPEFDDVGDIDLDGFGNVFVENGPQAPIKIYGANNQYRTSVGGPGTGAGKFEALGSMAVTPDNRLVAVDNSSSNPLVHVFTFNSDLEVTGTAGLSRETKFGPTELFVGRGITFDKLNRAYFFEFMRSEIRVTDSAFTYLASYANAGTAPGQLSHVKSAAFDRVNNRLLVSCSGGRIEALGIDENSKTPVYVNNAPGVPGQVSPVAGSDVASLTPTLVIDNSTDDDGDELTYRVTVSQGEQVVFEANNVAETAGTTSVVVGVALEENAAFSWVVEANDGDELSGESGAADFFVNAQDEAPSVPVLQSPIDGEAIDGAGVLTWDASTDPDPNDNSILYQVEVAADEAFAQVVAEQELAATELTLDSFATYGDLVNGSAYFWRVAALDNDDMLSDPSTAGQFVYESTALTITANMPDAFVSFSGNHAFAGQAVEFAPVELRDFAPGTFSVVVERAGFEPFVAQVTLAAGESVDLYAELVPAMAVNKLKASRNGINGRSGLSVSGAAVPFLVDFDNNGTLDMLVGDGSGQLTLFANMQTAGRNRLYFDKGVSLGLTVMSGAVPFVADWNNDGRKDLLVGLADGSVKLFVNTGLEEAPAFAAAVDIQAAGSVLSVGASAAPVVADYNGDGAKDLLVGNAAGQVKLFLNQGDDAAPALAAPSTVLDVGSAVVPFLVDWDADGQKEFLLTANGNVTVYAQVDGTFQAGQTFSGRKAVFTGAFPIDLNGTGKQLLVGQSNGQLVYLAGESDVATASFQVALQDKVAELSELVAGEMPEADVSGIAALVAAGNYVDAAAATTTLLSALPDGAAQQSAMELLALL